MQLAPLDIELDALKTYLPAHVDGFRGLHSAEKFSNGQSNPTYLLGADSGNYVLRRKPSGELLKSAHAVDREFKVLSALALSEVPVAKTYHLCEDDTVLGSMFYLMEYIDGRVLWDPALPTMNSAHRAAIYNEMNRVLACLHGVNIDEVGLADYGRPGNYFERQISRWSRQYQASATETIDEMEFLSDWLPANTPVDDGKVALVHGDFRLDNMMFHNDKDEIIALVDWELSTLGHPYADLAYQCMQLRMPHAGIMPGLEGIVRDSSGIPEESEYVALYCKRMGLDRIDHWDFYLVFSFFRFAAILQGVKKRALDGNASSDQARRMGELVLPLARSALTLC